MRITDIAFNLSLTLELAPLHLGQVRVELYDLNTTKFITAHDSPLSVGAVQADPGIESTRFQSLIA